jgi:hypothetical protein
MKKTTTKLSFDKLSTEIETLTISEQNNGMGGVAAKEPEYEYGVDGNGNWYYREVGSSTWTSGTSLNTVVISGHAGGGGTSGGIHFIPDTYSPGHFGSTGTSGGGGGSGGGSPSTVTHSTDIIPGKNDAWKTLAFGTATSSLVSQYETIYSNAILGTVGRTSFAGTINVNNLTGTVSPFTFTTTVTNGKVSSFDANYGPYSIGFLAEGGFTLSGNLSGGGTSMSIGFSLENGLIVGQSFTKGSAISGNEYNYKPGAAVLAGLAIVVALASDGGTAALFPELYGGLAI